MVPVWDRFEANMRNAYIDLGVHLKKDTPVTWLFCGDSITQGAVHTRGHRDYTQLFKERLGELARNDDIVINTAVGGWSTATLEPRLEERILRHQPDSVFLMFGTNDAVGGAEELEAFAIRYRSILKQLQESGIDSIIVQTTIPMLPINPEAVIEINNFPDLEIRERKLHGWRQRLESLASYVDRTRKTAESSGLPLVDHWKIWEELGGTRAQVLDGGFHPNEFGHRLIAHTLFKACDMWDKSSWTRRFFVPT